MEKLIEALTILMKYGNPNYPTHCEHDELYVDINPELVSDEDINKLEELHFYANDDYDGFTSTYFGSC